MKKRTIKPSAIIEMGPNQSRVKYARTKVSLGPNEFIVRTKSRFKTLSGKIVVVKPGGVANRNWKRLKK